jgi:SAM-dependent methyltransferase
VALRRRAKAKFPEADRMYFTPVGLEQATDGWIAAYKASRFRDCGDLVYDLCCGIGGDLAALARRGPAIGADRDPVAALLAKTNSPSAAGVVVSDVADLFCSSGVWHIDPDRRPGGRRTTQVACYEPGPTVIERLLEANDTGAIKLAPAAELPDQWLRDAEQEWISRGGECRQLVAWFGRLATRPGGRRATVIVGEGEPPQTRTLVGDEHISPPVAADFRRYLVEPDAAVLAAGLVGVLADEHGLAAIAPGAVYLTCDRAVFDPAFACFEIREILAFDVKRIKALLRERDIGRLEIKKRGVDIDPETLRSRLRVPGDASATLFVTRRGRSITALLANRIPSEV